MNNTNVEFDARLIWKDKKERSDAFESVIERVI